MKRAISLVLALVLCLALCGCGGGADGSVTGTWKVTLDMSEEINRYYGISKMEINSDGSNKYDEVIEGFEITFILTFNEDYTYTLFTDEDQFEQAVRDASEFMTEFSIADVEDNYDYYGLTFEELLLEIGVTREEYPEYVYKKMLYDHMEDIFGEMFFQGNYMVENGKLYLSDNRSHTIDDSVYYPYSVKGRTLTIGMGTADDGVLKEYDLPLEFKRAG